MTRSADHFSQQPFDLRMQVALVTGGSSGIGLAIARELDRRGSRVIVAGRNAERVDRAVAQLQRGVGFDPCDVRVASHVENLIDFTMHEFGRLDLVVASAGIGRAERVARSIPDPVHSLAIDEWDEVLDTNLRGMFLICRAAAQVMVRQRRGQILNISSARAALRGQPCAAAYSASKMAVLAMCQSLAEEVAPYGVRVTSFLPDAVDTSLISSGRLAPRGAMSPLEIGQFVADLLSLPLDTAIESSLLAPLGINAATSRATVESA